MRKIFVIIMFLFVFFFNRGNDTDILANKSNHWIQVIKKKTALINRAKPVSEKKALPLPKKKLLDVPIINQMAEPHLKNGCEVTSLAMLLNYYGVKVSKNELSQRIKKVPLHYSNGKKGNPNYGFVGNMVDSPGLSVYNGPIFDLAEKYMGKQVRNLTNRPFDLLLKKVSEGAPVWVITTKNFKPGAEYRKWETPQGTIFITFSEHSAVITGYDSKYIYVNDPYGYKNRKVKRKQFIDAWSEMGKQAITIEP